MEKLNRIRAEMTQQINEEKDPVLKELLIATLAHLEVSSVFAENRKGDAK